MRAFVLFTAGAAMFLAGCSGNRGDEADGNANGSAAGSEEYYTIRAGTVTAAVASALSGNFQLQRTGAPRGVASNGNGGACLVFASADVQPQMPAQCRTNAECKVPGQNVSGYCDAGTGGEETGTCWARPPGDLPGLKTCNRGVMTTQGALNPVPAQPVDVATLGVRPGAKVRVLACLNKQGFVPGGANVGGTGCAGTNVDAVHDWGPVATVR